MADFSKVKVGDIVFVKQGVAVRWLKEVYFWVPVVVEGVTPKQFKFSINEVVYRCQKKNGVGVGNKISAFLLGEITHDKKVVKDESKKKRAFLLRLKKEKILQKHLEELIDLLDPPTVLDEITILTLTENLRGAINTLVSAKTNNK